MAQITVETEISGSVWKVEMNEGEKVAENDVLLILESMKMEIPLLAPQDGIIKEIKVKPGDTISEGTVTVVLEV